DLVEVAERPLEEPRRRPDHPGEAARIDPLPARRELERALRRAHEAGADEQAKPRPRLPPRPPPALGEYAAELQAARAEIARGVPEAHELLAHGRLFALAAREQRIAGRVGIIRRQQRVFFLEQLPAAALREHLQPVGAQLLGERSARVPREEVANVLGARR